jgi:hypothetical protein
MKYLLVGSDKENINSPDKGKKDVGYLQLFRENLHKKEPHAATLCNILLTLL